MTARLSHCDAPSAESEFVANVLRDRVHEPGSPAPEHRAFACSKLLVARAQYVDYPFCRLREGAH